MGKVSKRKMERVWKRKAGGGRHSSKHNAWAKKLIIPALSNVQAWNPGAIGLLTG